MQSINTSCHLSRDFTSYQLGDVDLLASVGRWRNRQVVYCQDETVEFRYSVVAGAARRFAIQRDGRRQIVDFLLPGDFFGFARRARHAFTVEAMVDATYIARYPIARIEQVLASDPRIAPSIWKGASDEIVRLQSRVLILAQVTALERVGSFLLEMADRSPVGADRITLPMSRYDVADYLALAVETVCRVLSRFRSYGAIDFAGTRTVRIVDRQALKNCGAGAGQSGMH